MAVELVDSTLILSTSSDSSSDAYTSNSHTLDGTTTCIVLAVSIMGNGTTPGPDMSAITASFGGESMTLAYHAPTNGLVSQANMAVFVLATGLPSGSQTATVTMGGSPGSEQRACEIVLAEYKGVDTADPIGQVARSYSATTVAITPDNDDSAIAVLCSSRDGDNGPWTPNSDTTELHDSQTGSSDYSNVATFYGHHLNAEGSTEVTLGATPSSTVTERGVIAVEINPSTGGGASPPPLFKASGGTTTLLPTTSWAAPNALFPTTDRNDDTTYSWASSTSTLTLPASGLADGYLFIGAFEFEDTSNGRHNPQGKIVQASGTGSFVGGPTGGYNRDNSEDRAYVRTWAFVDNPSASATFQFQWKRDTDTPTGGTVRSEFQVIPLYYSNHGIYSSTSASLYGGTTANQVTGFTAVDESDTAAIELSSNVVTVKTDNKRYLVLGSQFFEGRGGRTQRWHGLEIDGSVEHAAKAYSYYRTTANDESGDMFTWLINRVTTNITIEQFCYRGDNVSASGGGADVDGSTPSVGDHALVVLELNDSAEVFWSSSNANSSNLATTGPVDLTPFPSANFNSDSASFSRVSDSAVNVEAATDVLFGANVSAAQNTVSATTRWTAYAEVTVDGVEVSDSFAGDYMRNNQGSQDTFGWSANLLGFQAFAADEDIGFSVTELSGSEGGGGNIDANSGWVGAWGINLATLQEAGGADALTADDVESSSEVSSPSLGQEHALLADDVESSSEVTSPAVGQTHVLAATSVESAAEVSAPALAEIHALSANGVQSASEVTAPNVGQVHSLAAASVESASETTAPTVGQIHALTADDVESASELTAPSAGTVGDDNLSAEDVESASEVSAPTLGQVHALTVVGVESQSQVSTPEINGAAEEPQQPGGFLPIIYVDKDGNEIDLNEKITEAVESAPKKARQKTRRAAKRVRQRINEGAIGEIVHGDLKRLQRALQRVDAEASAALQRRIDDENEALELLLMVA